MLAKIADWLDARTSYRALVSAALDEEIEGGARWAYVFGSALLVLFSVQVATGILLLLTYTPEVGSAWASVYYVQDKVTGGWFVRGLHHYGAQAMVVVLGMHILQVATYGAYKKPREVTWWFGLGLLACVQGLALTGYLLPWDQKGYWATKVATNIAGTVPVVGPAIQTLIVGGHDYGQSTLTRFFALHVAVLPAGLALLAALHVALFRKHGVTPPTGADLGRKDRFYPAQLARDVGFAVLVLGVVAILTAATRGAHLDAPADPAVDFPPRPEWYFLFLFQLLKYLPGSLELVGTVILPGLAGAFLFALPFLDRGPSRKVGDRLPWLVPIVLGAAGIVALTVQSFNDDAHDVKFQRSRVKAEARAARALHLAKQGIPPGGPLEMLRVDPLTHGPDVYAQYCQKCHVLGGEGERAAPDHDGWGSREWILGMLREPDADHNFGKTGIDGMKSMTKLGEPSLRAVSEFLFSLGHEKGDPPYDAPVAAQGRAVFKDKCMDCHPFEGDGAFTDEGPDMTGYASRAWIERQIADPGAETQYGEMNEMTAFRDELEPQDIRTVAAWLRLQRFEKPLPGAKSGAPRE
jgi:ubiquinol-cytochrome c reductase cytochrome b subunit